MAAHWNFPQSYEGLIMQVSTITNCEEVELRVNDKPMGRNKTADYQNNTIIWNVPYTPGSIEAVGYNGGMEVARHRLVTSGKAASCRVDVDRTELRADGTDVAFIELTLVDEAGNKVSTDDRRVSVSVDGAARLLAVDSGDLRREEHFGGNAVNTYFGRALAVVQTTRSPGDIHVSVSVDGLETCNLRLTSSAGANR
jgi:beta-galactosidase